MPTIYIAADKNTLYKELNRVLTTLENQEDSPVISAAIYGEGNSTIRQEEWTVEFTNDDMEDELKGKIIIDVDE